MDQGEHLEEGKLYRAGGREGRCCCVELQVAGTAIYSGPCVKSTVFPSRLSRFLTRFPKDTIVAGKISVLLEIITGLPALQRDAITPEKGGFMGPRFFSRSARSVLL